MTTRTLIAALSLVAASGAFAQSADRNSFDTEAQLRQPAARSAAGLTREEVRAQFLAARRAGDLNVFDQETTAYVKPVITLPGATRLAQKPADADKAAKPAK